MKPIQVFMGAGLSVHWSDGLETVLELFNSQETMSFLHVSKSHLGNRFDVDESDQKQSKLPLRGHTRKAGVNLVSLSLIRFGCELTIIDPIQSKQ
jgi:hypothetical protein